MFFRLTSKDVSERYFCLFLINSNLFSLGRDHGIPTYLQSRKQCGFNAAFKSFDDLIALFPPTFIKLLKDVYDDVEDIDLLVGGYLEAFLDFDNNFTGETLRCIIEEQYRRIMASDAYFYSHKTSPYPFTDAQIAAIRSVTFNHMLCVNSDVESVPSTWFLVNNDSYNPLFNCSGFKQMDLSAWKNI